MLSHIPSGYTVKHPVWTCILNAANEVVVAAFLRDEIGFLQMSDVIEKTMAKATFISVPTYEDYVATDAEARKIAEQFFN